MCKHWFGSQNAIKTSRQVENHANSSRVPLCVVYLGTHPPHTDNPISPVSDKKIQKERRGSWVSWMCRPGSGKGSATVGDASSLAQCRICQLRFPYRFLYPPATPSRRYLNGLTVSTAPSRIQRKRATNGRYPLSQRENNSWANGETLARTVSFNAVSPGNNKRERESLARLYTGLEAGRKI